MEISGGDFDDILRGGANDDNLRGDAGDDLLEGGAGADEIDGGLGTDTISYEHSTTGVLFDLSDPSRRQNDAAGDVVYSIENIRGSDSTTTTFQGFNDVLNGDNGRNVIEGGRGADFIVGGGGDDVASYEHSTEGVTVNLRTGINTSGDAQGDILVDIRDLLGSANDDSLAGDFDDNVLDGGAGNDVLEGGAGADTLIGGDGIDTVSYENSTTGVLVNLSDPAAGENDAAGDTFDGIENIRGSDSATPTYGNLNDALIGNANRNVIEGGRGGDFIDGGGGGDVASYEHSTEAVTVNLRTGFNSGGDAQGDLLTNIRDLLGSANADSFTGDGQDNVLDGGAGNDALVGGAGADTLIGGTGSDTADYASSGAGVKIDLTLGTVQGGDAQGDVLTGIENLTGSSFADRLRGDAGNNVLNGGAGNDALVGGAGADTLIGGNGIDTAVYTGATTTVSIDLRVTGAQTGGGEGRGDVLSSIENVQGGSSGDFLRGTDGANYLFGGAGSDTLFGNGGDDRLDGGTGLDYTLGGDGNDLHFVDNAGDILYEVEGGGIDTVFVSAAQWSLRADDAVEFLRVNVATGVELTGNRFEQSLYGGAGNDTLNGAAGNDRLFGGAGSDRLDGGTGADRMTGGDGDDTYLIDEAGDRVAELADAGTDTVEASISYTLGANVENLTLTGAGDLRGAGNGLDNVLTGNDGANVLAGGAGSDRLIGGLGKDQLTGGDGADTFVFRTVDDSTDANRDLILDFSRAQDDQIDLSGIDTDALAAGDQGFTFVEGGAFDTEGPSAQVIAAKAGNYTLVQGDVNGDQQADFSILLRGDLGLNAGDFVL